MANKKISQLNRVDSSVGITTSDLFPMASGGIGPNAQTASVTALDIATFCLSPMPASQINQPIGFTGNIDINFDKSNWEDASQSDVHNFPFLQVRKSDGLLVTGSGVAFDSATVPWNFIATDDIDMQHYDITGDGFDIKGIDKISFYNANLVPPWDGYNTYIDVDSNVPEDLHISADSDLELIGQTSIILTGRTTPHPTAAHGGITVGAYLSGAPSGIVEGQPRALIQFSGTDIEIDPVAKVTTNQINVIGNTSDYGSIEMTKGAFKSYSNDLGGLTNVNWARSNIAYKSINTNTVFKFYNVKEGQTYSMSVKNNDTANPRSGTFLYSMGTSSSDATTGVHWGEAYDGPQQGYVRGAPTIAKGGTNIYTFVCIETGVFASAVTGYAY